LATTPRTASAIWVPSAFLAADKPHGLGLRVVGNIFKVAVRRRSSTSAPSEPVARLGYVAAFDRLGGLADCLRI